MTNEKPIIGITIGDFNGIGPEIILKSIVKPEILQICTPVIYANANILDQYSKLFALNYQNITTIREVSNFNHDSNSIIVVESWVKNHTIQPGKPTGISGKCSFLSIQKGVTDLKEGKIEALITAPIDKSNIQSEQFNFPGHTEYLFKEFNSTEGLMILAGQKLIVTTLTGHIALTDVPSKIKKDTIIAKAKDLSNSIRQDFGIKNPKIAILGLNPHSSDGGLFGDEEENEIIPAIQELNEFGIIVTGPHPPDGFFGSGEYLKHDAILGMYHDQVLIPFKLLEFDTGVNFTSGLKGVRTSPDHGTAFDIAGKNIANPESFQHSILTAIKILNNRKIEF